MDRRSFLATGATVALLPLAEVPSFAAAAAGSGDARLNKLFEDIFEERVRASPGFATSLGLDKGDNARLRSTFDPKPYPQARAEDVARNRKALAAVRAISPSSLSPSAALNREIVIYDLERQLLAPTRFDLDSVQSPYLISQQDGNYFNIPDFLNSTHPIDSASDAEAYLSRLSEFAKILDFETAEQKRMAARGVLAPGWSLDLALGQMAKLREPTPADSGMVKSVSERAAKKGIPGDWAARATR